MSTKDRILLGYLEIGKVQNLGLGENSWNTSLIKIWTLDYWLNIVDRLHTFISAPSLKFTKMTVKE